MASYSQRSGTWSAGLPDLNKPALRVVNPPLYGTSLTAVPWHPGIGVISDNMLPTVYLQLNDLAPLHWQRIGKLSFICICPILEHPY
jgi:hypothetical protein